MIEKNNFYINNLKNVIFLGQSNNFIELIKINKSLNLKTTIITSPHQAALIDKKIKFKIFDKVDEKFKKFIKKNFDIKNTLFVSVGARYIFKKEIINNFFLSNLINFHGTRLPLDAGGGGFSWKIMREDRIDNQLCYLIDEVLDAGPVIYNKLSLIPPGCRIPIDLQNFVSEKFLKFYSDFITKLKNKTKFELRPQLNYLGRYNPRLNTEKDGLIDWSLSSYDLINFINAFDDPYQGASTYLNNGNFGKLYLKKVQLHGGDSSNHPYMAGIVSRHDKYWIVVSTSSKHMLLINEVFDNKGNNIISMIKPGDRFYTPQSELDNSKKKRTKYTSKDLKK